MDQEESSGRNPSAIGLRSRDEASSSSISWPTNRPTGNPCPWVPVSSSGQQTMPATASTYVVLPTELLPGQPKSLAGIALRAFVLGLVFSASAILVTIIPLILPGKDDRAVWRVPFFVAALSLFHFLEFFITAAYNTRLANISAFLLSQNGSAYNVAHSLAMLEALIGTTTLRRWHSIFEGSYIVYIGLALMTLGQVARSMAMAQAGTNFNHTVQARRAAGHELVTRGIYAWSRHPSYFGFFWWAIGTQVVLGNLICFCAYIVVLWFFFKSRIKQEEKYLISFFGDDYITYRKRTRVGIPLLA